MVITIEQILKSCILYFRNIQMRDFTRTLLFLCSEGGSDEGSNSDSECEGSKDQVIYTFIVLSDCNSFFIFTIF